VTLNGRPPRVLLYGKDGRTNALVEACASSPQRPDLFGYSQFLSPGMVDLCRQVERGFLTDLAHMVNWAAKVEPDLAIIGPEEPLEVGLVDALENMGIRCFGPRSALARVETSKAWARELMANHNIPGSPRFGVFDSLRGVRAYLEDLGSFVVKPDGLTGGKGVRVFGEHLYSVAEAIAYAEECLAEHGRVVIEEKLEGEEFSLQTITDGFAVVHCPLAQDHKRAFVGDTGPNTGGMGSYSCPDHSLPFLTDLDLQAAKAINEAVIAALGEEGPHPYRGVLYGGFMATADGVRVIEFNARFGDPEAVNVLPLLEQDFLDIAQRVAEGTLSSIKVSFAQKWTVCKYAVPDGYPGVGNAGKAIRFNESQPLESDTRVYFAAVDKDGEHITLSASRAAACVGIGATLHEAERKADSAFRRLTGPLYHRTDIGTAALVEARVKHMEALRAKAPSPVLR
jgi:phosphoribosylamine---glycine ligase